MRRIGIELPRCFENVSFLSQSLSFGQAPITKSGSMHDSRYFYHELVLTKKPKRCALSTKYLPEATLYLGHVVILRSSVSVLHRTRADEIYLSPKLIQAVEAPPPKSDSIQGSAQLSFLLGSNSQRNVFTFKMLSRRLTPAFSDDVVFA